MRNEKELDVVQISGGEPTIHPDFFAILDEAKSRPIKHIMVNTNGIKIAKDKNMVQRLATYQPGFEIYLQFDSFKPSVLQKLRGIDLSNIRQKAIDNLNQYNISTTLVVTLQKGVDTDEIGKIIHYAAQQPCIRGVTFQPMQMAGRCEGSDPLKERYTLTEVRRDILDQCDFFQPDDIIPVPCNPDALAMGYALKRKGGIEPLTHLINPNDLLADKPNTIIYEKNQAIRKKLIDVFSTGLSPEGVSEQLKSLLCCLPKINAPNLGYKHIFRVIIMQFMDAYNFDVRSVKRSCVHIVDKDYKVIPFETMNLFYRDKLKQRLRQLKGENHA